MSKEIRIVENAEVIDVQIIENKRAEIKLYDAGEDCLRTVKFNRQSWSKDANAFVDDPEKFQQCEEWAQTYFGCAFDDLPSAAIGQKKTVYVYDRFCSLWEVEMTERPEKFTGPVKGIIKTSVAGIETDQVGIHIRYAVDGQMHETVFKTAVWVDSLKRFIRDPEKEARARKKFEDTFGRPVEEAESLIGTEIQVQVKKAFNSYYGEILPL